MAHNSTDRISRAPTTRRNYLRTAGAAGVAGAGLLAGCSQSGLTGKPADGQDGGDTVDRTFVSYIVHHMPNRQSLNPWAATSIRPIDYYFYTDPVAPDQANGDYEMMGLESWSVGTNEMGSVQIS